jgi:hypothetical protein
VRKLAIAILVGLASTLVATLSADAADSAQLAKPVTLKDIRAHQKALQTIADYNGGNRAAGEPGFEVSVEYVVKQLTKAGYRPQVQDFPFFYFKEKTPAVFGRTAPTPATYVYGTDYATLQYSGSGDVTATVASRGPVRPRPPSRRTTTNPPADDRCQARPDRGAPGSSALSAPLPKVATRREGSQASRPVRDGKVF